MPDTHTIESYPSKTFLDELVDCFDDLNVIWYGLGGNRFSSTKYRIVCQTKWHYINSQLSGEYRGERYFIITSLVELARGFLTNCLLRTSCLRFPRDLVFKIQRLPFST